MRKGMKIWLITATCIILVGSVVFVGVMTMLEWDFSKLSTVKYETNSYEINDKFSDISVISDTAKLNFALSDDGNCRVECYEETKAKHSVTVENGTLSIKLINEKHWYDYIGINFSSPKITVYLPQTEYNSLFIKESTGDVEIGEGLNFVSADISLSTGDLCFLAENCTEVKIKTSTGNIELKNLCAVNLDLTASTGSITIVDTDCQGKINTVVSTGKTTLNNTQCANLNSEGSTGNIWLNNVLVKEKLSVRRSTGEVKFYLCDAGEIFIETDTGDVEGTLLTEKVFITQTDTGNICVPKTLSGGKCEIITDTGDIKIDIK